MMSDLLVHVTRSLLFGTELQNHLPLLRCAAIASRGHAVVNDDEWCHVFCFSMQADAERLMQRFGGKWFDPQTRGHGHKWYLVRDVSRKQMR